KVLEFDKWMAAAHSQHPAFAPPPPAMQDRTALSAEAIIAHRQQDGEVEAHELDEGAFGEDTGEAATGMTDETGCQQDIGTDLLQYDDDGFFDDIGYPIWAAPHGDE